MLGNAMGLAAPYLLVFLDPWFEHYASGAPDAVRSWASLVLHPVQVPAWARCVAVTAELKRCAPARLSAPHDGNVRLHGRHINA